MKVYFLRTCPACPEEYDIYTDSGKQIAYMRLRWGTLRLETPSHQGKLIYIDKFEDSMKGAFDNQEERDFYLGVAVDTLMEELDLGDDISYEVCDDIDWLNKEIYGDGS